MTSMQINDTNPSATFSTAHINIFSKYSKATIDVTTKCIGPFRYRYLNEYDIWNIWCPLV